MKILALDTSSSVASVAILDKNILMGEYSINSKKKHSQILMLMVKELLKNLDISPEDIDLYAVTSGPGSFTGLRIGITAVKAMAYAVKKPVIAVPSLEALAYNLPLWEGLVCPIMDARNNQVYTALYKWKGNFLEAVTECKGIAVQELILLIMDNMKDNNKVAFVGDGVEVHRQYIAEQLGNKAVFTPANLMLVRASSVALAAAAKYSRGEIETAFELVPFYLRKSQAERVLEKNNKGENEEVCDKV
ncbi:MAG TPA: tRNA (adenosine(37)-N6)-threonylcarbamoyltransferase complex dimerization subunit type 1 TsaB [Clostridiaceae bacterium]|nr:tRNA (adenosine(37)-N6)-threonylcarbamoyltransferase complex dimerization subunit type 1 TsaB [Clostridiaceae bacterium]